MNKRRKQSIWLRRNLPLLIAAAALVLLVLIIVLVARGCSKGSDTVIRAKAFSTGTTIELPLSAELNESDFVSYGGYQFTTKKKLSALSKLITKNNEGITAETYTNSYGECGVYTKTNESGGTDSWCLYVKDPKNTNENGTSSWASTARSRSIPARLICSCRCTSSRTRRCAIRCSPPSSPVRRIPAASTSCRTGRRSPVCSAHSMRRPVSTPSRPATRASRSFRAAAHRS